MRACRRTSRSPRRSCSRSSYTGRSPASSRRTPPERWHELATILDACDQAVREAQGRISIPKRFSLGVREMFALQPRLEHPRGRRALRSLEHPRFRAAYDLLLLRAQLGMASRETAEWWTRLQEVSPEERGRMADALAGESARAPGAAAAAAPAAAGVAVPARGRPEGAMERWQPAYVGLGSNLSDPEHQVLVAAEHLARLPRTCCVRLSPVYVSRPLGPDRAAGLRQRSGGPAHPAVARANCWTSCAASRRRSAARRSASAGGRGSWTSTCFPMAASARRMRRSPCRIPG